MIITGYISKFDGQALTIVAPFTDEFHLIKQNITQCEIKLDDGRHISSDQRKKIYATFNDIAKYTGHHPDEVKAIMKYEYIAKTGSNYFSLSDCNMTTANEFLSFLIEWCLEFDIPCSDSLIDRSPDIARYIYACLLNKKCAICGKKPDLHHAEDRVGTRGNRNEINHVGMRCQPLCREHHGECHTIGQKTFNEKYHMFGIPLDIDLCKLYKLKFTK